MINCDVIRFLCDVIRLDDLLASLQSSLQQRGQGSTAAVWGCRGAAIERTSLSKYLNLMRASLEVSMLVCGQLLGMNVSIRHHEEAQSSWSKDGIPFAKAKTTSSSWPRSKVKHRYTTTKALPYNPKIMNRMMGIVYQGC
jgi:hypothetical protein